MCPNITKFKYQTLFGPFWICYECRLRGHMLVITKPINVEPDSLDHKCECESIAHRVESEK
jgi:hypothetical protein